MLFISLLITNEFFIHCFRVIVLYLTFDRLYESKPRMLDLLIRVHQWGQIVIIIFSISTHLLFLMRRQCTYCDCWEFIVMSDSLEWGESEKSVFDQAIWAKVYSNSRAQVNRFRLVLLIKLAYSLIPLSLLILSVCANLICTKFDYCSYA